MTHLGNLLAGGDIPLVGFQDLQNLVNGLLSTSSQIHRVTSSSNVLDTFGVDGSSQDSSGGGTITRSIVGLGSNVLDESANQL